MRNFVRDSIIGGRCSSFIQLFKSQLSDEVPNIISPKNNVNGNI